MSADPVRERCQRDTGSRCDGLATVVTVRKVPPTAVDTLEGELAGHAAARALRVAGVEWVSGVAGESFLPLLDGMRREGITFVSTLHESSACFLASAHARITARTAVVAVTRGPGASNALIGIHESAQAGAPIVLIVGQLESRIRGRKALQEMEFTQVFASVAKAAFEVTRPDQLAPALIAAIRKAESGRPGPVVVSVPADHFFGQVPVSDVPRLAEPSSGPALSSRSVERLAGMIRTARRGVFVAGPAFSDAANSAALSLFAKESGFGVLGGHAYPDVLEAVDASWLGCSSLRGSDDLRQTLREADTVILLDHWLGDRVSQGYMELSARIAAISRAPEVGWDEYLQATLVTADPIVALAQLRTALGSDVRGAAERRQWVQERRLAAGVGATRVLDQNRQRSTTGISFADIIETLDERLPRDITVVSDAGSYNDWILRYLPLGGGRRYLGPISGSMGFGVPAAIGAQLARPGVPSVALVGDGGFLMTGLELATAVRLNVPLTVLVFRNRVWGSIALHQDRQFPGSRFGIELPVVSFASLAQSLGATGVCVSDRTALAAALREALKGGGPTLIEVETDPDHLAPSVYERGVVFDGDLGEAD